jgi:hypothetical protein
VAWTWLRQNGSLVEGFYFPRPCLLFRPPQPLGNLSVNGYASAADTVTLHFCNPTTLSVGIPAGVYSFLAVH